MGFYFEDIYHEIASVTKAHIKARPRNHRGHGRRKESRREAFRVNDPTNGDARPGGRRAYRVGLGTAVPQVENGNTQL